MKKMEVNREEIKTPSRDIENPGNAEGLTKTHDNNGGKK